jgi:hypothetical protein
MRYDYKPGIGGGINQHMSKERRQRKQERHRKNMELRREISRNAASRGKRK